MNQERSGPQPIIPTEGLTAEEDRQLASLLSKWTGGRISTPVFTEIARIIPQPIVEVVLLREKDGVLETLLIPRPADDILWPGMYHTPGAALRASDFERADNDPLNGPFERIQQGELNCAFVRRPTSVGRLHRMSTRGPEVAEVYVAQLPKGVKNKNHWWYPVGQLATNPSFIQHQLGHVLLAVEQSSKTSGR